MRNTGPVVPLYDGILFVHGTTTDQITVLTETYLADHPDPDEDGWRVIDGPVNVGPHHIRTDDEGTQYVTGPGPDGTQTFTGAVVHTLLVDEDTVTFRGDGTAYRKYAPGQPTVDLDALLAPTPNRDATTTAVAKALRAVADRMDATDQQAGNGPQPHPAARALRYAYFAAHGVTTLDEWGAETRRLNAICPELRIAWWEAGRIVLTRARQLVAPDGFDSPRITAAEVRAMADRLDDAVQQQLAS